jgi:transcriptional regulator with XRE-family HTH domain
MNIGSRIRKIRKRQGRTLEAVGRKAGCTRSLLSKIETGATSPPVATLTRIADTLGVPLSAFMEDTGLKSTVFTRAGQLAGREPVRTDKGYQFLTLAAARSEKLMQPFMFTARKGEVKKHRLSHQGEEFVYMLKGEMKYRVGDIEYRLRPGDLLYFDAEEEHEVTPVSRQVKYLAVFTEPKAPVRVAAKRRNK